jgi:hypothetical protein
MKRITIFALAILFAVNVFAAKRAPVPLTPIQQADALFDARGSVTDTASALIAADRCIDAYKKLLDAGINDELLFKYLKAVDFKYSNLVRDIEPRKQVYKDTIAIVDKYCGGNTFCASSNYISYCYMTLWGRYGDMIDIMEAATSGIAGKVKDNAEKLYTSDKTFKDHVASLVLGRLHYKAPNIFLIMTWPDKNLSKKYLEEYVAANPGSLQGKFFLADTLWE